MIQLMLPRVLYIRSAWNCSNNPHHSNNNDTLCTLVYYPMTPSQTLSIRCGAIIQAVNIHCIGYSSDTYYYGACLRSTISILQMAPPECETAESQSSSIASATGKAIVPQEQPLQPQPRRAVGRILIENDSELYYPVDRCIFDV